MKAKKEYLILIAIIIALSVYLYLRNSNQTHYTLPILPEVKTADISKIEIKQGEKALTLDKQGDVWKILPEGYPADSQKIEDMLETLSTLKMATLISESKNYVRYDLGPEKRISVKALKGTDVVREFNIGKTASSYQHTFVTLAGDDKVYHADNNFRNSFEPVIDNLRDKKVFDFDDTEIQEIMITKGETSVSFALNQPQPSVDITGDSEKEKKEPESQPQPVWQTKDGQATEESKIKDILTTVSKLTCETYVDGKKKEDFTQPICTVIFKGTKEYTLSLFEKIDDNAKYPAISSENDYPFLLSEWQAKKFTADPQELIKKAESKPAKAKTDSQTTPAEGEK